MRNPVELLDYEAPPGREFRHSVGAPPYFSTMGVLTETHLPLSGACGIGDASPINMGGDVGEAVISRAFRVPAYCALWEWRGVVRAIRDVERNTIPLRRIMIFAIARRGGLPRAAAERRERPCSFSGYGGVCARRPSFSGLYYVSPGGLLESTISPGALLDDTTFVGPFFASTVPPNRNGETLASTTFVGDLWLPQYRLDIPAASWLLRS